MALVPTTALLAGCAQLGVVSDATSISVGRPNEGKVVDAARVPDQGEGFFAPATWKTRGNRYGTDELVDLIVGVGRRLASTGTPRLAVADLSVKGGGEARRWHRSHQSGRDLDLIFYVRDAAGKPVEPTAMLLFDSEGKDRAGSGMTIDVARNWLLVRDLVTAPEASVQWVFMYEPIAEALLAHAIATGEPELLVARARRAMRQPGDSAKHDDHIHVRVFCSAMDRALGCVDTGSSDMLAEREHELTAIADAIAARATQTVSVAAATQRVCSAQALAASSRSAASGRPQLSTICMRAAVPPHLQRLATLLGGAAHRLDLRWL